MKKYNMPAPYRTKKWVFFKIKSLSYAACTPVFKIQLFLQKKDIFWSKL